MIDRMMDGPGLVGSCPGVSEGERGQGVHLIFHIQGVREILDLSKTTRTHSSSSSFQLSSKVCALDSYLLLRAFLSTNSSS